MHGIKIAFIAMISIVAASNYLVQIPINEWLTWGAFAYPISFLVTELTVRFYGSKIARKVVYAGFAVGVLLSLYLSAPKIAIASGLAFLVAQLLDILIFSRLRSGIYFPAPWWVAPFWASAFASIVDSAVFWNVAFFGENMPLLTLAAGNTAIKIVVDVSMLTPFRIATRSCSKSANEISPLIQG
jgi:queuosine precursor transporter